MHTHKANYPVKPSRVNYRSLKDTILSSCEGREIYKNKQENSTILQQSPKFFDLENSSNKINGGRNMNDQLTEYLVSPKYKSSCASIRPPKNPCSSSGAFGSKRRNFGSLNRNNYA